jgi:hypothetical protein
MTIKENYFWFSSQLPTLEIKIHWAHQNMINVGRQKFLARSMDYKRQNCIYTFALNIKFVFAILISVIFQKYYLY